jgi:hypothetical protein
MIGGGHENLWKVPLGKQWSFMPPSNLQSNSATKQTPTQRQAGRFVVMFCEAMWFKVIRDTFLGKNWEKETFVSQAEAK